MPFKFQRLEINNVIIVEPVVFKDERGFFLETYKESDFHSNGIICNFRQDNHSYSKKKCDKGAALSA